MQKIALTQDKFTLVDDEDYLWLNRHKWFVCKEYAATWLDNTNKKMHRLILSAPPHLQVDHINGNKLDNRRFNLRLCTRSQNKANIKRYKGSKHPYKGIAQAPSGKYSAQIRHSNKIKYLGTYDNIEAAARAYDRAAVELHGEFASTNFQVAP